MYKGSKKTVLVFKGRDNRIFDEAHFIVKDDITTPDEDIVKEANRIISEYGSYTSQRKTNRKKEKNSTFWYICGLMSGCAVFFIYAAVCNLFM